LKKEELKEGDVVFFNIRTKRISHVGIYLMNDFFVHSSSSQGVMISKLTDAYWKKYYAGAGRVPKVGTTTSIVTN
jgi:lipoprotein Spr